MSRRGTLLVAPSTALAATFALATRSCLLTAHNSRCSIGDTKVGAGSWRDASTSLPELREDAARLSRITSGTGSLPDQHTYSCWPCGVWVIEAADERLSAHRYQKALPPDFRSEHKRVTSSQ